MQRRTGRVLAGAANNLTVVTIAEAMAVGVLVVPEGLLLLAVARVVTLLEEEEEVVVVVARVVTLPVGGQLMITVVVLE